MKEGPCTCGETDTGSAGGEKVVEEGDKGQTNLHEVFTLRVTKLRGSVKCFRTESCSNKVGGSCILRFRRHCIWTCKCLLHVLIKVFSMQQLRLSLPRSHWEGSLKRALLYLISNSDTVLGLERIMFLHVAFSVLQALLLFSLYELPTLAGSGRDLPSIWNLIFIVVRFLPKLRSPSRLEGSTTAPGLNTALSAILPQLLMPKLPSCVWNFISDCVYYGFQYQKRSPIVQGTIQTLPVLDRSFFKWIQARLGVWGGGRREDVTHKQNGGLQKLVLWFIQEGFCLHLESFVTFFQRRRAEIKREREGKGK